MKNLLNEYYYASQFCTPDSFGIGDTEDDDFMMKMWYLSPNAKPFFYLITSDQLILGENGTSHGILAKSKGLPFWNNNDNLKALEQLQIIAGRVWVMQDGPFSCVISTWNFEDYGRLVCEKICEALNLDFNKAFFVMLDHLYWAKDMTKVEPVNKELQKQLQQIHLATQQDKRNFFAQFRKNRDAAQAEANRQEGWGNASQAEVNFWKNKGLDESKGQLKEYYRCASHGSPDYVELEDTDDENYYFEVVYNDYIAWPFFYITKLDQLIIGKCGETHQTLFARRLEDSGKYGKFNSYKELTSFGVMAGRIWIPKKQEGFSCVIASWNYFEYVPFVGKKLCVHFGLNPYAALFVNRLDVFWISNMKEYRPKTSKEDEIIQQIHLANQRDKRNFFAQFRQQRDSAKAEHNRQEGWGSASQAEVNFWKNKGLDEMKQKQPINEYYISNRYNTPDEISISNTDTYQTYRGEYGSSIGNLKAFPYFYDLKRNKLFVGENGETHGQLDDRQLSLTGDYDDWVSYDDLTDMNLMAGRVWLNAEDEDFSCVITSWNLGKYIPYVTEKICEYFDIDPSTALFTEGDEVFWVDDMEMFEPKESEEKQKIMQIHLADQQAKKEFFSSFRQNRDAAQAEANRQEGWGNASQAEVNFWKNKGLDEHKTIKSEFKRILKNISKRR